MKVTTVHRRFIASPFDVVSSVLKTIGTHNDKVWPVDKWPAMRFQEGLKVGASGGHGPIRYTISAHRSGKHIRFAFIRPKLFHGYHEFELHMQSCSSCVLIHRINMNVVGWGIVQWIVAIRFLHDALLEDLLDKVEGNCVVKPKAKHNWSTWVRLLRSIAQPLTAIQHEK